MKSHRCRGLRGSPTLLSSEAVRETRAHLCNGAITATTPQGPEIHIHLRKKLLYYCCCCYYCYDELPCCHCLLAFRSSEGYVF